MPKQNHPGLCQKHGSWYLRYYEKSRAADGRIANVQRWKKLATLAECPTLNDVRPLYTAATHAEDKQNSSLSSAMTLRQFWHHEFMPHIKKTKKDSTQQTYGEMWRYYFENEVGHIRMRDFRKSDAIQPLERMAYDLKLAHSSVARARTVLGAIFKRACARDLIEFSPIRDFETPRREGDKPPKGQAYTAQESEMILRVLAGRARVVAAIFAYSGIRPQELAGLEWKDYKGEWLYIRQAVWKGKVVSTKTDDAAASIPVIEPLAEILDAHRAGTAGIGWIISGETGNPVNLTNLARREVRPVLKACGIPWKGWYAFRRGVATTMSNDVDLSEESVRSVLRHAPGSDTARQFYITAEEKKRLRAMQKFSEHIREVREQINRPVLVS